MKIDRAMLRMLNKDVETALESVGKKFGLSLKTGSTRFTATTASIKLEAAVLNPDGTAETADAKSFKQMAHFFGLKPELLNQLVVIHGTSYYIRGLRPRSSRFPVIVERQEDGKMCKMPTDSIVFATTMAKK